ncbi:MAG TPA: heat-inducible transcriptional repressor HrcA [Chloroflexota bacterium]|nr:heat-inducible transcriptional repressor HrcA [Chloroflexota bacterium]
MELTERQERILQVIVDEYIATAHPVGSAAIVAKSGLGVSSATVRNEMAMLEEYGYIRHLHTSGGRVPTNAGYRFYVERLMGRVRLPSREAQTIRHQFHQAHMELQEWLKLAAAIMATRLRNVGLITAPRSAEAKLRHLEAISIQQAVALLIVVLQDGCVVQEMVSLPEQCSQEELSAAADTLTTLLRGLSAAQVEAHVRGLPAVHSTLASKTAHLLRRADEHEAQLFHAGLPEMLRQPEFAWPRTNESAAAASERLGQIVEFLQQGVAIQRMLAELPRESNVQVVIGGEAAGAPLQDYSFVLGRYGGDDESWGFLGVIGPTRMEYPRAVALVRYMTDLMSDLLDVY